MSKCRYNWAQLPNSRMDRQRKPGAFFRQKETAEDIARRDLAAWKKLKGTKSNETESGS